MDTGTPIIVKRGFFSTLAYGVSGVLITGIICGTGVGLYGMRMLDRKSGDLTALAKEIVAAVPDIIAALPPVLADALNDRRDPGYRSDLEIEIALRQDHDGSSQRPVLIIKNNGDQVVSLLGLRVVLVDEDGLPVEERNTFAATPLPCEDDWRGPILPGETRKFSTQMYSHETGLTAEFEVTEIRLWNGPSDGELVSLADKD